MKRRMSNIVWLLGTTALCGFCEEALSEGTTADEDQGVSVATWEDLKSTDSKLVFSGSITADSGDIIDKSGITQTIVGNDNTLTGAMNSGFKIGGGVDFTLKNLTVSGFETAKGDDGGVIQLSGGNITFDTTTFKNNHAGTADMTAFGAGGVITQHTNAKSIKVLHSVFDGNYANEGGVMNVNGLYDIYDTKFSNNYAVSKISEDAWAHGGGAIFSGYYTSGFNNIIKSQFEGNYTNYGGGAINFYGTYANIVETEFKDNGYAEKDGTLIKAELGGAISGVVTNLRVINSSFENNQAGTGGAIYINSSDDGVHVVDTSFTGNKAEHEGGAIYAAYISLNIFADTKDVLFQGNEAGIANGINNKVYNAGSAIYADESEVNLNAGEGRKIVFDDTIAAWGETMTSVLNINKSDLSYTNITVTPPADESGDKAMNAATESDVNTGTVEVESEVKNIGNTGEIQFNNHVGDLASTADEMHYFDINLYGGKLSIGQNAENNATVADPDSWIDGNNLMVKSGILNSVNNHVGKISLKNLTVNGNMEVHADVDLANGEMDQLTADDVTVADGGKVSVTKLNLLSDAVKSKTSITYANEELKNYVGTSISEALTELYKYDVSYDENTGDFIFSRHALDGSGEETPASFNPYLYEQSITLLYASYLQKTINAFIFNDDKGETGKHAWMRVLTYDDDYHYRNLGTVNAKTNLIMAGVTSDEKEVGDYTLQTNIYGGVVDGKNRYDDVKSTDNGGFIGAEARLAKGNWRYGANVTGGMLRTHADNMYGTDKYSSYWGGVAARVGYEIALSPKMMLEPGAHIGWTVVKTNDFTTANGTKSRADNLKAWDLAPNLKLTRIFNEEWQGFAQARYVFTDSNSGSSRVDDTVLPDIATHNYAEYGVGAKMDKDEYSFEVSVYRREGQREGWNGWLGLQIPLN